MQKRSSDQWLAIMVNVAVMAFLSYALLRPAGPIGRRWNAIKEERQLMESVASEWERLSAGATTGLPVVVEFVDYECPFCRSSHDRLVEAQESGRVEVVYRQLPLIIHHNAEPAARAALCADRQGRFGEIHELMMTTEEWLDMESPWEDLARHAGVQDTASFVECLSGEWVIDRIADDRGLAEELGVSGTPTFIGQSGQHPGGMPTIDELVGIAQPRRDR